MSRRVLIVEGDPRLRTFMDVLLTRRGFNTVSAPNALEADALLLDFPSAPDIAVLDLLLPHGEGLHYADRLLARYPAIRLIFLTGVADKTVEWKAEQRGLVLYKPFHPRDLLFAIGSSPIA